jgi:hypothetical protein
MKEVRMKTGVSFAEQAQLVQTRQKELLADWKPSPEVAPRLWGLAGQVPQNRLIIRSDESRGPELSEREIKDRQIVDELTPLNE